MKKVEKKRKAKQLTVREPVGRRIKEERKARGFTQSDLAKRARITQTHVSRIEKGFEPSIRVLGQIAHALDVDLPELVRGTREELSLVWRHLEGGYYGDGPICYCPNTECPLSRWLWSEDDDENMYFAEYFKLPRTVGIEVGSTSPVEPEFCPHCSHPLVKTCKKCGLDIQSAKHQFCVRCGEGLFREEGRIEEHIDPHTRDRFVSESRGLRRGAAYSSYKRRHLEDLLQDHEFRRKEENEEEG